MTSGRAGWAPRRGGVLVLCLVGLIAAAACGRSGSGPDGAGFASPPPTTLPPWPASRAVADAASAPVLPAGLPAGAFALRVSGAAPVRVSVPGSGVDAPVEARGTAADGALDLPPDAGIVAWYRDGPSPGAAGSAVLAAHVDYGGRLGVFAPLLGVEVGALVDVAYDDGTAARFEVVDRRSYAKSSLPLDELFRRRGAPRLVMVTCGGAFDRATRYYTDNVVVTAVPVG